MGKKGIQDIKKRLNARKNTRDRIDGCGYQISVYDIRPVSLSLFFPPPKTALMEKDTERYQRPLPKKSNESLD